MATSPGVATTSEDGSVDGGLLDLGLRLETGQAGMASCKILGPVLACRLHF
jgi:hypothetical protein